MASARISMLARSGACAAQAELSKATCGTQCARPGSLSWVLKMSASSVHVGEPMPSMPGSVREHEALEQPFRLARPIEHGIGRDEVGGCDRARITHGERDVLRGR